MFNFLPIKTRKSLLIPNIANHFNLLKIAAGKE